MKQKGAYRSSLFGGISLCVIGVSGSGKTALMAKLASEIFTAQSKDHREEVRNRPVIVRFCGTSPGSADGFSLVVGLCAQIKHVLGFPLDPTYGVQSYSRYDDAVSELHMLVKDYPMVLLIDSLDQLSNRYLEMSDLSFLRHIVTHEHTRIIVSSLPDDRVAPSASTSFGSYYFGCETCLRSADVPRVETNTLDDPFLLLQQTLRTHKRSLTSLQWETVKTTLSGFDVTTLYLTLAVRVLETWTSFTTTCTLPGGVRELISLLFDGLDRSFGTVLTRAAIGFISLARDGVSDAEMVDLLTLDGAVMASVNQYNTAERLPSHVWLRLRGELRGLIVEKGLGCLGWYHRQLKEVAAGRYSAEEKIHLHRIMAIYYADIVDEGSKKLKGISDMPLLLNPETAAAIWMNGATVNRRRCAEAGHHLIQSGMLREAVRELCTIESVCSRALCKLVFELSDELNALSNAISSSNDTTLESGTLVKHYLLWIKQYATTIQNDPCMNTVVTCGLQAMTSLARGDLLRFLSHYKLCPFTSEVWVRSIQLGCKTKFDALLQVLDGHLGGVMSVKYNFDGSKIASGSEDKSTRVWDGNSGALVKTMDGHSGMVTSVNFSRDGCKLASGSFDKMVKVWMVETGSCIGTLRDQRSEIAAVQFHPDGSLLASSSYANTVFLWSVESMYMEKEIQKHKIYVSSLCFNTFGTLLATAAGDGIIRIWDVETGAEVQTLYGHNQDAVAVKFNRDSTMLASSSWDCKILLRKVPRDIKSGDWKPQQLTSHRAKVGALDFNKDGSILASGSDDATICIWSTIDGTLLGILTGHTSGVNSVSFHPGDNRLVSGSGDKSIRIWDSDLAEVKKNSLEAPIIQVLTVCFHPSGDLLASGHEGPEVYIWDLISYSLKAVLVGHTDCVYAVKYTSDGRNLASSSMDQSVRLWDGSTGELLGTLLGHTGWIWSLSFSGDGSKLISSSFDQTAIIWDVQSKNIIHVLRGHSAQLHSACLTEDGLIAASATEAQWEQDVFLWCVASGECLGTLTGHTDVLRCITFHPDSKTLLSGSSDCTVRIWNVITREQVRQLDHPDGVASVAASNDGSRVATGTFDGDVFVWDFMSGSLLLKLHGHSRRVGSVCFSADNNRIVSGSDDATIRIWEASMCDISE